MAWAEVYYRTKRRLHPSSRLATIDIGHGWEVSVPFFLGELGPIEHKVAWAEAYTSIPSGILVYPAVWPQRTLAENMGAVPL